jgi:hypothetical protein
MTLAANQAYLPNTGTENIPFKNFEIKQPDGIKSAVTTTEGHNPAVYYNLKGQRVEHPTRGIYIRNGSKVFVK